MYIRRSAHAKAGSLALKLAQAPDIVCDRLLAESKEREEKEGVYRDGVETDDEIGVDGWSQSLFRYLGDHRESGMHSVPASVIGKFELIEIREDDAEQERDAEKEKDPVANG